MTNFRWRYVGIVLLALMVLGGCTVRPIAGTNKRPVEHSRALDTHRTDARDINSPLDPRPSDSKTNKPLQTDKAKPQQKLNAPDRLLPLKIQAIHQTGRLQGSQLDEISGMSASARYPGLLYAINDSGNAPTLFAITETGRLLTQWDIIAGNRDWEEMTQWDVDGHHYLVIGDTGDNLRIRKFVTLHLVREPEWPSAKDKLTPEHTINFRYDDGPRNVEAFSISGNTLYLLSKEPVTANGHTPHRIYQLELPDNLNGYIPATILTARFVGTMPSRANGLEAKLVAALAGVDLTHPTSLEFNASENTAYILTYREVLRVQRKPTQSWADAFSKTAERVMTHNLPQAEALSISPGRAVWFTSENVGAPLWAIPLVPPL